ncbi:MAG TPA: hypothetical protein VGW35_02835 [Methylomirabilota bacterium]|jgi:hypothetical protein|nr:hypothetical protein [Methylomirabilota bacterium]
MTTVDATLARRLSYRLDTLWDFDYEPTHHELESLYETAKKNQWNASTAIDWSRPPALHRGPDSAAPAARAPLPAGRAALPRDRAPGLT